MEALSSVVLAGLVVVSVVDAVKDLSARLDFPVNGFVTVLVAALVGALCAVVDGHLGFAPDLTIAQGISVGLSAAGAVGVAKRVG